MKLKLPSGTTGFWNDKNEWQCTGSQMGRRDCLPSDRTINCKLRMERLRWVGGDYDQWGAYWGRGNGNGFVYCAHGFHLIDKPPFDEEIMIFSRSLNREGAKIAVKKILPNARFYR